MVTRCYDVVDRFVFAIFFGCCCCCLLMLCAVIGGVAVSAIMETDNSILAFLLIGHNAATIYLHMQLTNNSKNNIANIQQSEYNIELSH